METFFKLQKNPHLIVTILGSRGGANVGSLCFNRLKQWILMAQMRIDQAVDTHTHSSILYS